jgi:hypothetical protein
LVDAAGAAPDAKVRVERIAGDAVTAERLTAIGDGNLMLAGASAGASKVPLSDVVEIAFPTPPDPPAAWRPTDVAVDLASGEVFHGEIKGGSPQGFTLSSPLIGSLAISIDHLSRIRFLQRLSRMAEPPDLRTPIETDMIHLADGDRIEGTVEGFTQKGVRFESATDEKLEVAYERINALRIMTDAGKKPGGTLLVVVLRDGSQAIGSEPSVREGKLQMRSVSGFDVAAALTDVVAAHVLSPRLSYLSDLPTASIEVTPFWKPVAGDPAILYAPRMDHSFHGRTLRCGGRTWVKGIGVYSGTSLTWNLDGNYAQFRASVGIDDGAGPLGGVVFEVLVDGKSRWSSGLVRPSGVEGRGKTGPVEVPRVDLSGAKTLTLRVLSGDKDDPWPVADEADWLGALLVK